MILASSNENDVVLDPFLGSGTSLRVCQQTNRIGIGIDINEEYVQMSLSRLTEPFTGFDSIDERMKRVPDDLNNPEYRKEYLEKHVCWFLKNHSNELNDFFDEVYRKYGDKI